MTANPFAALLRDVPRLVFTNYGQPERFMKEELVLAALAAAVPADLAEAGKVLEGVTPGPWETDERHHDAPYQTIRVGPVGNYRACKVWQDDCADDYNPEQRANARFIAWCRAGVPALIARIRELEGERDDAFEAVDAIAATDPSLILATEARLAEASTVATLTAQVEAMRGAIRGLVPGHRDPDGGCWCHWGHDPDYGHTIPCQRARAALTTENQTNG